MTFREKIGVAIMCRGQVACMTILATVCHWIVGRQGVNTLVREMVGAAQTFTKDMPANSAAFGMAREGLQLELILQKVAARVRPDSMWTFHKIDCGRCEGVIMPRTIDSNTVVVTATTDPNIKLGDVITIDGNPPNCEPAALKMIIDPEPDPALVSYLNEGEHK